MYDEIEPAVLFTHGFECGIYLTLVRNVAGQNERIREGTCLCFNIFLQTLALKRKRHPCPMFRASRCTRPSDRTLIRDAEDNSYFVFQHINTVIRNG